MGANSRSNGNALGVKRKKIIRTTYLCHPFGIRKGVDKYDLTTQVGVKVAGTGPH